MDLSMSNNVDQKILLVSGPIAVGKSSVMQVLIQNYFFQKISSGSFLIKMLEKNNKPISRLQLIELGDQLDNETDYLWVVTEVAMPAIKYSPDQNRWLFDSVRKRKQVCHFRSNFPNKIYHVHLTADDQVLSDRYALRKGESDEIICYNDAINTENEKEARSLGEVSDLIIDNSEVTPERVAAEIMERFL